MTVEPVDPPFYSFDTSAFINGRNDIFKPKTFGPIWEAIGEMIASGQVRAIDPVKWELEKISDETKKWAKSQRGLFVPLKPEIQFATKGILASHAELIKAHKGTRSGADPFVIALAMTRNGTVVTQETVSSSQSKPRIPNVCKALGVKCMTLPEFVDSQDWDVRLNKK